jgi:KUP system potassium uptake protein
VPGTAVFLTSAIGGAPPVLLHHLKHNKVLHERVILLSIVTEEVPQVWPDERVECTELGQGFYQVIGHYGFMESPDVPTVLAAVGLAQRSEAPGGQLQVNVMQTSFYLGRETLIATRGPSPMAAATGEGLSQPPPTMSYWRKKLFILMTRNARSATAFFGLPPNRVVELGAQIQF